jgi:hypothetical protein
MVEKFNEETLPDVNDKKEFEAHKQSESFKVHGDKLPIDNEHDELTKHDSKRGEQLKLHGDKLGDHPNL